MDNYPGICKYNSAILCIEKTACKKCGWNPKVEEKRKKQYREGKKK